MSPLKTLFDLYLFVPYLPLYLPLALPRITFPTYLTKTAISQHT